MRRAYLLLALPALLAFRTNTFEPEEFFWITPTAYVDGTPLAPSDILAYLLSCSSDKGGVVQRTLPGGATTAWAVPDRTFDAGTWQCVLRTRAQLDSSPSLPVEFVIENFTFTVVPMPPTGLGAR
jgi:hypothetical protein